MKTGEYNEKQNQNYTLNYVKSINSVMAKPFYVSSTKTWRRRLCEEDKEEVDDSKELKNEETERKIVNEALY